MTISYPLVLPSTPGFKSVVFHAASNIGIARSPYTFRRQVQDFGAGSWAAEVSLPPLDGLTDMTIVRDWEGFLYSLKGNKGTLYFGDPMKRGPVGSAVGSPVIHGGAQVGDRILTAGWTASTNGVLVRGDKVQFGNRMYVNLSRLDSDGSGYAWMDLWPDVVTPTIADDVLITNDPKGVFSLIEGAIRVSSADVGHIYDISFSLIEVI